MSKFSKELTNSPQSRVLSYAAVALLLLTLALLFIPFTSSHAASLIKTAERASRESDSGSSFKVAATGSQEVAFSPNEGGQTLVIKVIDSAKSELLVLSYSFTSGPITQALLRAKHRGVNVVLVADYKNNVSEDRSGKARAALSALVTAGVDVRTISVYPIHHDKTIVADRETVELGSFNYSDAAAHKNSENVLVNWKSPALAEIYRTHFDRNYKRSTPYKTQY